MKRFFQDFLILASIVVCAVLSAARRPSTSLPRSAPEAQGVSSAVVPAFLETPFYATLKFRFEADRLIHESEVNVGFGPTKRSLLVVQTN